MAVSGWCLTHRHAPACRYEPCTCACHLAPEERARRAREERDGEHISTGRNSASSVIQSDIQQEPTDTRSEGTDWADSPEMENDMSTTITAPKTAAKKAPAKSRSTATGSKTRPAASRAKSASGKPKPSVKAEIKPVNKTTMNKFVKEVWNNVNYTAAQTTALHRRHGYSSVKRLGWDDARIIQEIGDAQTVRAALNRVSKAAKVEEARLVAEGKMTDPEAASAKKDTDSADA